jgi:hypothetical protein
MIVQCFAWETLKSCEYLWPRMIIQTSLQSFGLKVELCFNEWDLNAPSRTTSINTTAPTSIPSLHSPIHLTIYLFTLHQSTLTDALSLLRTNSVLNHVLHSHHPARLQDMRPSRRRTKNSSLQCEQCWEAMQEAAYADNYLDRCLQVPPVQG